MNVIVSVFENCIAYEIKREEIPTSTRELKRQLKMKAENPESYKKLKNKLI